MKVLRQAEENHLNSSPKEKLSDFSPLNQELHFVTLGIEGTN